MLDDLTRRLQAALPGTVPVLPPEEFLVPAEWEQEDAAGNLVPSGERGLHVYLRQQAPDGYVQLHDLQPLSTQSGWADQHLLTVACIATTEALAQAVASQVRRTLGGTPRTGHRTRVSTPARVTREPGSVMVTLQFTVLSAHPR
ncbi:hypothetical protein GCM10017784_32360 [Deinococcus indicus]|uniref:hypothetical protein n=1 Tax=Deinococcus indicus TaxID=223556 RepID=UPI001747F2CC|nr:hypothetical protein [Deinococcus indicus]GHG35826.1 hypothetical protein GCM10017784_32360 [Deinococcus indicus]